MEANLQDFCRNSRRPGEVADRSNVSGIQTSFRQFSTVKLKFPVFFALEARPVTKKPKKNKKTGQISIVNDTK